MVLMLDLDVSGGQCLADTCVDASLHATSGCLCTQRNCRFSFVEAPGLQGSCSDVEDLSLLAK